MRSRLTGLLLALILLAAAVPAALDCCAHPPSHGQSAARVIPASLNGSVRGCVEHAAPSQTPYIETASSSTGSGSAPASAGAAVAVPATALHATPRYGRTADATGPPLWLSDCVSRT